MRVFNYRCIEIETVPCIIFQWPVGDGKTKAGLCHKAAECTSNYFYDNTNKHYYRFIQFVFNFNIINVYFSGVMRNPSPYGRQFKQEKKNKKIFV